MASAGEMVASAVGCFMGDAGAVAFGRADAAVFTRAGALCGTDGFSDQ